MNSIRLKVNGTIPGFSPGQVVKVPADERGIPLDLHWRRRLKDSEIDGCIEVVVDPEPEPIEVMSKSKQKRLAVQTRKKKS